MRWLLCVVALWAVAASKFTRLDPPVTGSMVQMGHVPEVGESGPRRMHAFFLIWLLR